MSKYMFHSRGFFCAVFLLASWPNAIVAAELVYQTGESDYIFVSNDRVPQDATSIGIRVLEFPSPFICNNLGPTYEGEVWIFEVRNSSGDSIYKSDVESYLGNEYGEICGQNNIYFVTENLVPIDQWPVAGPAPPIYLWVYEDCHLPIGSYTFDLNGHITPFEIVQAGTVQFQSRDVSPQPPSTWLLGGLSPVVAPSTQDYEVKVVDSCKIRILQSEVIPNVDITLQYSARPFSGGHVHHDANRPNGIFDFTAPNYQDEPNGLSLSM